MKNKDSSPRNFNTSEISSTALRKKAENIVRDKKVAFSENLENMNLEEIQQTLHELHVHQVELEIQNEELKRIQVQLDILRTKYFNLFDLAPVGYFSVSEEGIVLETNLIAATMLGVTRGETLGQPISNFICYVDQDKYYLHRRALINTGETQKFELRLEKKKGSSFWVHMTVAAAEEIDGTPILNIVISDITKRKCTENALKNSEERYRLITENTSDVISIFNLKSKKYTYFSPSILQLRGLTPEEALKEPLEDAMSPDSVNIVRIANDLNIHKFEASSSDSNNVYTIEIQQPCKDGSLIWVEVSTKLRSNPNGDIEAVSVSRNVTERKNAEQELLYKSNHDHLTGLYNRRFYEEELIRLDTERNLPLTILIGDINGLKAVNDTCGHNIGDELLKKAAEVIKKGCRADDIISRIGGDEFVVLLPKTSAFKTDEIISRIKKLLLLEKVDENDISISFGYGIKSDMGDKTQEVFSKAEENMYKDKLLTYKKLKQNSAVKKKKQ